jgi:hypothetical protein
MRLAIIKEPLMRISHLRSQRDMSPESNKVI